MNRLCFFFWKKFLENIDSLNLNTDFIKLLLSFLFSLDLMSKCHQSMFKVRATYLKKVRDGLWYCSLNIWCIVKKKYIFKEYYGDLFPADLSVLTAFMKDWWVYLQDISESWEFVIASKLYNDTQIILRSFCFTILLSGTWKSRWYRIV